MPQKHVALSLFWRTFVLLAILLAGGVFAWTQTFRALEFEPRAVQAAQQIASLVNLSRAALGSTDGINRVALIKSMQNQESMKLLPREPSDKWEPYEVDRFTRAIGQELRSRLGPDTLVASEVNGAPGLWVGFSFDSRTPRARLRPEAEMSVQDDEAKRNMALDIDQLDAIIDKFMDYARPGEVKLTPVHLSGLVDREMAAFRDPSQIRISSRVAIDTKVMADDTELGRVLQNLFENARRYGRSTDTGIARVTVSYARTGPWVILSVRDNGPGVDPKKLGQLTTPFFRGDAARTAATGAGLGLAIVEKAVQRMGGTFEVNNAAEGGLVAHVRLKRAP